MDPAANISSSSNSSFSCLLIGCGIFCSRIWLFSIRYESLREFIFSLDCIGLFIFVGLILAWNASVLAGNVRAVLMGQGSIIFLVVLALWAATIFENARVKHLLYGNFATLCTSDGDAVPASIVKIDNNYVVLMIDNRWAALPFDEVSYFRSTDSIGDCSLQIPGHDDD